MLVYWQPWRHLHQHLGHQPALIEDLVKKKNLVDDAEDLFEEEEGGLGCLSGGVDKHLDPLIGQADPALEGTTS